MLAKYGDDGLAYKTVNKRNKVRLQIVAQTPPACGKYMLMYLFYFLLFLYYYCCCCCFFIIVRLVKMIIFVMFT